MRIYRGKLELLDYVFFATVERGKVYETGAFIHNYALAYALGLARSAYAHRRQEPHYAEELAPLNEAGVYLTPAGPLQVAHRLVQWNTIREGYAFPGKVRSIGYPDWGFARVLRPGSSFVFYVLVEELERIPGVPAFRAILTGRPAWVRLGKFPGKARIRLMEADQVREKRGDFQTRALLNWRDLLLEPAVCDIVAASLPTRLLTNAHFADAAFYEARFGEERVCLPVEMRFLARPLERRRRR